MRVFQPPKADGATHLFAEIFEKGANPLGLRPNPAPASLPPPEFDSSCAAPNMAVASGRDI
jgi:hypothetical protein